MQSELGLGPGYETALIVKKEKLVVVAENRERKCDEPCHSVSQDRSVIRRRHGLAAIQSEIGPPRPVAATKGRQPWR